MKIALSFPGCHRRGGVERVVLETANFLDGRGHEVHLFSSEWDEDALRRGVIRHRVPLSDRLPLSRTLGFRRQCARVMEGSRIAFDAYGAWGAVCPPGGVVWVQSVHRAWLEISRRRRGWAGRLKQRMNPFHPAALALERACFGGRRYDRLIALTPDVKDDLIRCYQVPPDDIEIIPNGFAPEEFSVERARRLREPVRRELGYTDQDRVVIFVANELERKGFGPLLRAVASLGDERLRLLAVGRLDRSAYAGQIERLGMSDRVRFTGPTSDAARYYAAADLFALPTQYEAWGLVIVEAMACGLPVLTSRLAGAAVAVREGETGELLDNPDDEDEVAAKLRLMLDREMAGPERIAASVARYGWPGVLQRYEQLLCQLAEKRATATNPTRPAALVD